jgi:methylated-DNA-protein-cysteine methyltransferase-like protein
MSKSSFTSPPDITWFNQRVWEIVRQIPGGKVATYGQIASLVPLPEDMDPKDFRTFAPRWVGGAMAHCPGNVPWYRVVNGEGKISLSPAKGGTVQRELLEREGVKFDSKDRIEFKIFRWKGLENAGPGSER